MNLSVRSVHSDEKRRELDALLTARDQIEVLFLQKKSILSQLKEESNRLAIQLESNRWRLALELFMAMRIEVYDSLKPVPSSSSSQPSKAASNVQGCSTILGLPLLNSGHVEDIPIDVVSSAFSHIAHLVDCLSAALNIPLPHRLLPFLAFDHASVQQTCNLVSTRFIIRHLFIFVIAYLLSYSSTFHFNPVQGPTDSKRTLRQELRREKESSKSSSESLVNRKFSSAVSLLRANVVSLCLRAGLEPEALQPPPCLLLNLHLLHRFCIDKVEAHSLADNIYYHFDVNKAMISSVPALSRRYRSDRWRIQYSSTMSGPLAQEHAREVHDEDDWTIVD